LSSRPSLRRILADYGDSYLRCIIVLALNVPVIGLLLIPDLRQTQPTAMTVVYIALVVVGYYSIIPWVLITLLFLISCLARRVAVLGSGLVLAFFVYLLAVDTVLFSIFRFHLDAFWIVHIVTDYPTMGVPLSALLAAMLLLLAVGGFEVVLFRVAARVQRVRSAAFAIVGLVIASYLFGQAIHAVAYEQDHSRIAALTPRLPQYHPLTWHRQAVRHGALLSWAVGPAASPAPRDTLGFRYPLRPVVCPETRDRELPNIVVLLLESWRYDAMDSTISPHIARLASQGSCFLRHFSSGNSTPTGVFGIFYGIHPTYWDAIKAQSASLGNPVLIDLLRSHGYAIGIYSKDFSRHKIADTIFRGIAVRDSFAGTSPDERDADMNRQLETFITDAAGRRQPFLAFEFFKSTHYSYYYPPAHARFEPHRKLNVALAGDRSLIPSYLNDYRNAVNYVDDLVGHVIQTLRERDLMRNTIIVVTGDHGEEFNDDGAGYWGHATNFTQYQTRVPLVLYVPGQPARRVSAVTMHVDIATTLIQQICGCGQDPREYSNGMNLLQPLPMERPVVASSYVNHAWILGDDAYAVYPMYVQRYKLNDVNRPAGRPRPDELRQVMEEITRFRGGHPMLAAGGPAQRPPAVPTVTHGAPRKVRSHTT